MAKRVGRFRANPPTTRIQFIEDANKGGEAGQRLGWPPSQQWRHRPPHPALPAEFVKSKKRYR
jgi:hypothetical protein